MKAAFEFLSQNSWIYGLSEASHHGEHGIFSRKDPSEQDV